MFLNDTILENQTVVSLISDAGGAPGDSAGNGFSSPGTHGPSGTANGGGIYSQTTTTRVGNSIIDLNSAGTTIGPDGVTSIPFTPTTLDIAGNFTSLGDNLLGNDTLSTFNQLSSDSFNITATQLNLGLLENNGGLTETVALLPGSVAIDAGNNALVPSSDSFDGRGTGYTRVFNSIVDIGAFEFERPTITSYNPVSIAEGSGSFALTLNGSDFQTGTTEVTVPSARPSATMWMRPVARYSLTITNLSSTQLTVNIPVNIIEQDGPTHLHYHRSRRQRYCGTHPYR